MQKVPVAALTARLKKQKAVLSPAELPKGAPRARVLDASKLAGVVVDDGDAKRTGEWKLSSAMGPYVGTGYLHDGDADKGKMRVRFTPKLAKVLWKEQIKAPTNFFHLNQNVAP